MSSEPPCDICGGARVIRLPVRRPLLARGMDEEAIPTVPTSREFACPECANTVPESHVAILEAGAAIDIRFEDEPGFMDDARRHLVHALARHLRNHVTFDVSKPGGLRREMVATIGVVAKGRVASIEERARVSGGLMCARLVEESIRAIRHWGSASRYFNHTIHHNEAERIIRDTLGKILKESKAETRGHHDDNREETKVE